MMKVTIETPIPVTSYIDVKLRFINNQISEEPLKNFNFKIELPVTISVSEKPYVRMRIIFFEIKILRITR